MDVEHTVGGGGSADEALLRLQVIESSPISVSKKKDGIGLMETVLRMQPRLPFIMIAGFGGVEIKEKKQGKRRMGFLNKPFSVLGKLLSLI